MATAEKRRVSYAEYAKREKTSDVKHEFLHGELFAMAGGTPEHGALASVVNGILQNRLASGTCRAFTSDVKVRTPSGLGAYPDISVVCGTLERDAEDDLSITNPTVIVEVLSDGTKDYDRGEKFDHYRTLPSLKECLFVSHRQPLLELRTRNENGTWEVSFAGVGESIMLRSIDVPVQVDAVYRGLSRDDAEGRMRLA
jgi:Uma2 family endonuclease